MPWRRHVSATFPLHEPKPEDCHKERRYELGRNSEGGDEKTPREGHTEEQVVAIMCVNPFPVAISATFGFDFRPSASKFV